MHGVSIPLAKSLSHKEIARYGDTEISDVLKRLPSVVSLVVAFACVVWAAAIPKFY